MTSAQSAVTEFVSQLHKKKAPTEAEARCISRVPETPRSKMTLDDTAPQAR